MIFKPNVYRSDKIFLYQINISDGGVPKYPVEEAWITYDGVAGDHQRNQNVHGGADRAVCLYSLQVIEALRQEGHSMEAGSMGENLTLSGLQWSHLQPTNQIRIGQDLRIEIMSYAEPCRQIARWFDNREYKRISQKTHPGWSRLYARVLSEGLIRTGDPVRIEVVPTMRCS